MGSANYWIAIFGEPVRGKPWAWLLTGHHLGATFTCAGGRVSAAPLFLGAQPLEDLKGPYAGFTVFSHEGLRGLDLVSSLHPEQAKVAVLSKETPCPSVSRERGETSRRPITPSFALLSGNSGRSSKPIFSEGGEQRDGLSLLGALKLRPSR